MDKRGLNSCVPEGAGMDTEDDKDERSDTRCLFTSTLHRDRSTDALLEKQIV